MDKYVWIGPRESDIFCSTIEFDTSITWYGSGETNNISYIKKDTSKEKDYYHNGKKFINFIEDSLDSNDYNDYKFMFYNQLQYYLLPNNSQMNAICVNSLDILNIIRDKGAMRNLISNVVNVVPYVSFKGDQVPSFTFNEYSNDKIILQESISSGGNGTHLFNLSECNQYLKFKNSEESYIISPYIDHSIPINVHMIVFDDDCTVFPISHQIIYNENNNFYFMGADYNTHFSEKIYKQVIINSLKVGEKLRNMGYRGVCGIDYLIKDEKVLLLEVNPRFQASTFLLNNLLTENGKPSIQELNIMAFSHIKKPFDSFSIFENGKSYFNIINEENKYYNYLNSNSHIVAFLDGYNHLKDYKENTKSYYFRVMMNRNISWVDYDNALQVAPNILPDSPQWREKIFSRDILALKISLLNQGVKISANALEQMNKKGMIRKGVFQSVDLKFNNGMTINAPYLTDFSEISPFKIDYNEHQYILTYYEKFLDNINFDTLDINSNRIASKGTIYRNVSFLATDRLRIHHQFRCNFKMKNLGCKFCNVKPKTGEYNLKDVFEVIDYYLENVPFRHFLIGGGSGTEDIEQHNIIEIATYIRKRSDKPIYAMCLPPQNISILETYKESGVNEISFNIEIFDRKIAEYTMPGKGKIPITQYEQAFKKAIQLWGNSGNVRSMFVLGMEPLQSFYSGIKWLSSLGVMPIISIFRPVTNIAMKEVLPYSNEKIYDIFLDIIKITSKYNLYPGPPCIPCQNNTLSLPKSVISSLDIY